VLNLHMPQTSGFDVQARPSQSGHTVPLVIGTGYEAGEGRARAFALGAKAYRRRIDEAAVVAAINAVAG